MLQSSNSFDFQHILTERPHFSIYPINALRSLGASTLTGILSIDLHSSKTLQISSKTIFFFSKSNTFKCSLAPCLCLSMRKTILYLIYHNIIHENYFISFLDNIQFFKITIIRFANLKLH